MVVIGGSADLLNITIIIYNYCWYFVVLQELPGIPSPSANGQLPFVHELCKHCGSDVEGSKSAQYCHSGT
jgi:hypothetical protein